MPEIGFPKTIAVVMDCDDTLAPDTTAQLFTALTGEDPHRAFYPEVGRMAENGWDGTLAYLTLLFRELKRRRVLLTRSFLREFGKNVQLFDGIPNTLKALRRRIERFAQNSCGKNVQLKCFVITSGIEELVESTAIREASDEIFGCTLEWDDSDRALGPKSTVSFTEKTKFVYAINKGITKVQLRQDPLLVNRYLPEDQRPVPLSNMLYVGDGPTDIPCFSIVGKADGRVVGIAGKASSTWAGRRIDRGPYDADYGLQSQLTRNLRELLEDMVSRLP